MTCRCPKNWHVCYHGLWDNAQNFVERNEKTKQNKTKQDKTKQNKTRQDKTRQDKTRQKQTNKNKNKTKQKQKQTDDKPRNEETQLQELRGYCISYPQN